MVVKQKRLVLFTLEFPFGKGETFIENELPVLSDNFEEVHIIPSSKTEESRAVPHNVKVVDYLLTNKTQLNKQILSNIHRILPIYFWTLFNDRNWKKYLKHYKSFFGFAARELALEKKLKQFISKHNLQDAICYDYWFVNRTLLLAKFKKEGIVRNVVCRAHRFDLYDEIQHEGIVSYTAYKTCHIDKIALISQEGYNYMLGKIPKEYHHKLTLSYLGVKPGSKQLVRDKLSNRMLIVSCARLIASKRVSMIAEALSGVSIPVVWHHFGDGIMKSHLFEATKSLPGNVDFVFEGEVENKTVLRFYEQTSPDLFVSLSKSEGLPVSMMEAISCGIPILACDVNGVKEIVNDATGKLINEKTSAKDIAELLENIYINYPFDSVRIIDFFKSNFEANRNFNDFVEKVLCK